MKLTNEQIYNYAIKLSDIFINQKLPIKLNFYLQKNKSLLLNLAKDIEAMRLNLIKAYGIQDGDEMHYSILPENIEIAKKELSDLLMLEQEVEIYQVSIEDFSNDLVLTTEEMEALMFMIK